MTTTLVVQEQYMKLIPKAMGMVMITLGQEIQLRITDSYLPYFQI